MTVEEFNKRASEIYIKHGGYAGEEGHMDMDDLMVEALEDLGYGAGIEILFSMRHIWYS